VSRRGLKASRWMTLLKKFTNPKLLYTIWGHKTLK
jgi:hypothetical protein